LLSLAFIHVLTYAFEQIANRIGIFRKKIKSSAVSLFASYLHVNPENTDSILKWIENDNFIYPGDVVVGYLSHCGLVTYFE
jgi:hypothetical protein